MTNRQLRRAGGLALVIGAIAFIVHTVLRSVITAGADPATSAREWLWILINVTGVIGAVLVVLGMPVLYGRITGSPSMTDIGVTLLAAAWMFFGLFLSLYAVLVLPWLAAKAPSLVGASSPPPLAFVVAFFAGLLAWLLGAVVVGGPFISRRAPPAGVGYMLDFSAVRAIVGNVVLAPTGPASNLVINLLSNMGIVLLMIGLGYLGYRIWSDPAPV